MRTLSPAIPSSVRQLSLESILWAIQEVLADPPLAPTLATTSPRRQGMSDGINELDGATRKVVLEFLCLMHRLKARTPSLQP